MGEGNFFSKSLAQVGTPSCCTGAKGNKPPKNGYGGKFSLIRGGGVLIKTRQMETERGKRLFSTLSQRCLNQSHVCNQNRSGDSYLLVPEFKAPEVRQQNRVYFLCKHSHTSFSVTYCLILVYCDILSFMADIISIPTPSLTLLFVLTFALQPQSSLTKRGKTNGFLLSMVLNCFTL